MQRFADSRGYTQYIDENNDSVREHELAALAHGYSPEEVFDKNVHLHHQLDFPEETAIKLDLPLNIVPVSRSVHCEIHAKEAPDTRIESILTNDISQDDNSSIDRSN